MSLFVDSLFSAPATDASSTSASLGSTPPTTVADTESQASDSSKHDVITVADDAIRVASAEPQEPAPSPPQLPSPPSPQPQPQVMATATAPPSPPPHAHAHAHAHAIAHTQTQSQSPPSRRPRRARVSEPVYNLAKLSGTADHGKRRAKGHIVAVKRRRTISGETLVGSIEVAGDDDSNTPKASSDASHPQWSPSSSHSPRTRRQAQPSPRLARTSSRRTGVSAIGASVTNVGSKGRKAVQKGASAMSRELRRLQDTNEYSGLEDRPVVHTIWSNGKYVDPSAPPAEPARKKVKAEEPQPASKPKDEDEVKETIAGTKQRKVKKYLDKGLYAGQDLPFDACKGLTMAEKKKLASLPELVHTGRVNAIMPPPIFAGLRLLIAGRDFKLPFNVCNPMPPGQPKPDEWKKMTRNRFIGDSKDYWRKMPHLHDLSKCVCKPEDGCGDNCQNRIMLYECDAGNCNVGKELCTNRSFADLAARRAKGGKYRVGVEVIKTSDRGYGVRSNRCFKPNQIIMEYTGEIITEEECERRMNEVYKNNECYYLMSFDQNMIIDATTGSIARFVNHSCDPNCRMIKWIVSGQPRMALFAGDRPIMTGDELTYDYNFDPFSAKNVQKCLCGQNNCRGVLGPRPRDVKPPKTDLKKAVKVTMKAGKRKLKELLGDGDGKGGGGDADRGKAKKRKLAPATPKRLISNSSLKAAKGAASAIKKRVSSSLAFKGQKTMAGSKVSSKTKTSAKTKTPAKTKTSAAESKTSAKAKASAKTKTPAKTKTSAAGLGRAAATTGVVIKKTGSSKVIQKKGTGNRLVQVSSRASSTTTLTVGDKKKVKGGKKLAQASSLPLSKIVTLKTADKKNAKPAQPGKKTLVSVKKQIMPPLSITTPPRPGSDSPRRIIKLSPKAKDNAAIRLVQKK